MNIFSIRLVIFSIVMAFSPISASAFFIGLPPAEEGDTDKKDDTERRAREARLMEIADTNPEVSAFLFNSQSSTSDRMFHSHPYFGKKDMNDKEFLEWFDPRFAKHKEYSGKLLDERLKAMKKFKGVADFRGLTSSCSTLQSTYDMLDSSSFANRDQAFNFIVQIYKMTNDDRTQCAEHVASSFKTLPEEVLKLMKPN